MRVLLILLLTLMFSDLATAQNRDELEKQRSDIQREIEDVKRSLSQTKKQEGVIRPIGFITKKTAFARGSYQ